MTCIYDRLLYGPPPDAAAEQWHRRRQLGSSDVRQSNRSRTETVLSSDGRISLLDIRPTLYDALADRHAPVTDRATPQKKPRRLYSQQRQLLSRTPLRNQYCPVDRSLTIYDRREGNATQLIMTINQSLTTNQLCSQLSDQAVPQLQPIRKSASIIKNQQNSLN